MGFLRRNDNAKPDYTALQLQTSVSTLPIPIVWGRNKIAPNLLWYANFQAVPGGAAKGSAARAASSEAAARRAADYTYTADLIMGLCEGPLSAIGPFQRHRHHLERPLDLLHALELGLGSYAGTTPQPVWPYLASIYPSQRSPTKAPPTLGSAATTSATRPRSATTMSRFTACSPVPASTASMPIRRSSSTIF